MTLLSLETVLEMRKVATEYVQRERDRLTKMREDEGTIRKKKKILVKPLR